MWKRRKFLLLSGVALIFILLSLVNISSQIYTFSSRAQTPVMMKSIVQNSVEPIPIDSTKLPRCVTDGEYLLQPDGQVCYARFICILGKEHILQNQNCGSLNEHIQQAAALCGCS
ncbi:hypothetical protein A3B02_01270 [Candidatus Roizmanbacteria bacterium RIFCSPLOWO2_01_FULL_42_14]|uniref:Uncharacterized protein n=4 Tax=Candidatus Roizmaniibacteriota TaxID=1752723 RepID=A0A1F7JUX9_9BACT|nr:MAG: hypothetical protein A3D08_02340 [Candidatus Roizmanbacteria bacterium RIFCSPHIGHO2_02_FULL_43_11]OGK38395.1 MAG: hypothetical protein A3F32_00250 [Candidatus Roizmanbacteria bacterium RIFCSPHIGHO2_12_FULL_42_10]OGK52185.1 MAG: hypothetical protein A3B02_01270 [Candidatus Roizmanbacteria bacterium RIFCSPLOWO2_01_FULL_42_14]OGK59418.1 MAG: hypothetical protein A3I56_01955 [Candidatus Roizmanbacteria bacterium RIFCSPLOWO2_02_FULL_43_10]